MSKWTIMTEFQGGTYIVQVDAGTGYEAMAKSVEQLCEFEPNIFPDRKLSKDETDPDVLVAISGTQNVWNYIEINRNGDTVFVNIVKTDIL
ncbi:MAG: hypothetical protein ACI861_000636 [Paracoccaceae bacterium]|jgi:hypothetical protein